MNKRIWLALIASTVAISGHAVAQIDASQATGPEAFQRAILAAGYGQNPRLMFPLPGRPPFLANRGVQPYRPQTDSSTSAAAAANAADFITFDLPGSSCCSTLVAINPEGVVTGYYFDASNVYHGFLRASDGAITPLDAPGAGTGTSQGTSVSGINPAGAITGQYSDANYFSHGFLRAPDGTFTAFDVPGYLSSPGGINPAGEVAGVYLDANFVAHGFLRAPDGTITTFDFPLGSFVFSFVGPSINPSGAVAGTLTPASCNTATCVLLTAPLPRSTLRAPETRTRSASTRRGRSREPTMT
jgi:hypothetical protein